MRIMRKIWFANNVDMAFPQGHRIKFVQMLCVFLTPPQPSPLTRREPPSHIRKSPLLAGEIERGSNQQNLANQYTYTLLIRLPWAFPLLISTCRENVYHTKSQVPEYGIVSIEMRHEFDLL
jgi:hypothetical protein